MKKLMIGSAAVALVVAMSPAGAQPAPPSPPGVAQGTTPMVAPAPPRVPRAPQIHTMIMSDRTMTRGEVAEHVAKLFARLDANHDGFVTREELNALHARMMAGMERGMDGMTRAQQSMDRAMHAMDSMPKMPMPDRAAMFDRLDTNHDGSISRQEYMAAKPRIVERQIFRVGDGNGPPMPIPPGDHEMMIRMHAMGDGAPMRRGMNMAMGMGGFGGRLFDMADSNHDGRVSLQEAQAAALAHFDRADLNHDGKITPDERQQMHREIRLERRAS